MGGINLLFLKIIWSALSSNSISSPVFHFKCILCVTVRYSIWNFLSVDSMVFPSNPLNGPLKVTLKFATEHVQLPWRNSILYGSLSMWLSESKKMYDAVAQALNDDIGSLYYIRWFFQWPSKSISEDSASFLILN